jgi:hypothetical protein
MTDSQSLSRDNQAKVAETLKNTRATLRRAELALANLEHARTGEHRVAEMCNVIVMGRAVTNVLQNLRHAAPGFDDWYSPWEQEMSQDPFLKYIYKLRSEILKKGKPGASVSTYVMSFNTSTDIPPAPPNATSFFIGDEYGGSGWRVRLADGTLETMYVELPAHIARSWLRFDDVPREHLGAPIGDDSLENVCRLYVQYLQRLVVAAEQQFGNAT